MVKTRRNRNRNRKSRRSLRRERKSRRRNAMRRRTHGGSAPLTAFNMEQAVTNQSMAQGRQFAEMNRLFHGGSAPVAAVGAPPLLTPEMASIARVAPLDASMAEIKGMQDGGRRRRRGRKGSRKGRKASRKTRRFRGGAFLPAEVAANPMLLSSGAYKDAGLNPEWRYVEGNPMAYAPK